MDPDSPNQVPTGQPIGLTPKAFAPLEYLINDPYQVVTHEMIEQLIRNDVFDGELSMIGVSIRRRRQKIDAPFASKGLTTVRGIGYRLQSPGEGEP